MTANEYDHGELYCVGIVCDVNKPKLTNAERIRAMSDEELAEFIGRKSLCERIQGEGTWCENHAVCRGCLTEWLQQPVEGTEMSMKCTGENCPLKEAMEEMLGGVESCTAHNCPNRTVPADEPYIDIGSECYAKPAEEATGDGN